MLFLWGGGVILDVFDYLALHFVLIEPRHEKTCLRSFRLCSEKGADQLRCYRATNLRLCFRMCKIRFSHDAAELILNALLL